MPDPDELVVTRGADVPAREPDPLKGGDVYGWAAEQAALIRAGRVHEIDWVNVADEIDSVGNSEFNALESELAVVLQHILKWDYQPERRSRSWELSIREHRRRAARRLDQNPSLRPRLAAVIAESYADGRDRALAETGLRDADVPVACPYSLTDLFERPFVHGDA